MEKKKKRKNIGKKDVIIILEYEILCLEYQR